MRDSATNWRDLADGLTDHQVQDFIYRESIIEPTEGRRLLFVEQALAHIKSNRIDQERFGHIPPPAAARRMWHWEVDREQGGWHRDFEGQQWTVGGVSALILGRQYPDSTVTTQVTMDATAALLGPDELRRLAAVLCAAADELEKSAI